MHTHRNQPRKERNFAEGIGNNWEGMKRRKQRENTSTSKNTPNKKQALPPPRLTKKRDSAEGGWIRNGNDIREMREEWCKGCTEEQERCWDARNGGTEEKETSLGHVKLIRGKRGLVPRSKRDCARGKRFSKEVTRGMIVQTKKKPPKGVWNLTEERKG